VIADVFQCPVRVLRVANASALGAALRAAHGAGGLGWERLFEAFVAVDPGVRVEPDPEARPAYAKLSKLFEEKVDQRLSRDR